MLTIERLKELRIRKKLTQSVMAERTGFTRNYISMVEAKKRRMTDDFYRRYVDALNGKYYGGEIKK